jgi:hypothetical protein
LIEKELQLLIEQLKSKKKKLIFSLELDKKTHEFLFDIVIELFSLYHKNRHLKPSEVLLLLVEKNKEKFMNFTKLEVQKILYVAHCILHLQMDLLVEEYKNLNQEYNNLQLKYNALYRQLELLRAELFELQNEKPISQGEEMQ